MELISATLNARRARWVARTIERETRRASTESPQPRPSIERLPRGWVTGPSGIDGGGRAC
jgi:hypothetical protein